MTLGKGRYFKQKKKKKKTKKSVTKEGKIG